jgi:hypothetical protein
MRIGVMSRTGRLPCAATCASAVPQAPAPITPILMPSPPRPSIEAVSDPAAMAEMDALLVVTPAQAVGAVLATMPRRHLMRKGRSRQHRDRRVRMNRPRDLADQPPGPRLGPMPPTM